MTNKVKKGLKLIKLPSGRKALVRGVRSIDGTEYVYIKYGSAKGYVPRSMFVGEKGEARSLLKQQRVLLISDKDWAVVVDAVDHIQKFKVRPLIERTGWTGPYFALRDGTIFAPPDVPRATAIFPAVAAANCVAGTHGEWLEQIGKPLTGQHLLMFGVMAALASPLAALAGERLNFGFELSGPPERGKTTWLLLFASTAMRPTGIPTFHSTRTGQEDMFAEFRDMPFPVDEANLADSGDKHFIRDFAYRFANGVPKITRDQSDRERICFVFVTTANQPIRDALGNSHGDTSDAALQRLIPLKVEGSRPEGVFTFVPVGFANSGAFATYLGDKVEQQYGTPMRQFLAALVAARAKDPEGFTAKVRERIAAFNAKVGIAATARSKSRASTAFGIVYAAGSFAKANGVLLASWDCMGACVEAYRNYQSCLPDQTPLPTRILTIAQRHETLDLRDGSIPRLTDVQLAHHGAFIKRGVGGRIELLLTESAQRQFFPDWKRLKTADDFEALCLSPNAGDHDGVQRQVRQGKKRERFICFVLPPELVALLPQTNLPNP